jgi:hypothetical protein
VGKNTDIATACLHDVRDQFAKLKKLAEGALAQATDEDLHVVLDRESNSIAVIMRHMAGNLRSRFTDFLTTDGEKPDRNRDGEFEMPGTVDRAAIMDDWESGERHSVIQALNRQMTHHAYHVGQIVFLAKHLRSSGWTTLSIPKRRS